MRDVWGLKNRGTRGLFLHSLACFQVLIRRVYTIIGLKLKLRTDEIYDKTFPSNHSLCQAQWPMHALQGIETIGWI